MTGKSLSIGLVLLMAGCVSQPMTIPESGTAAAQLFATRCSSCHALPHPARNTANEWPGILALMDRRMRERHIPPINGQERDELLRYLQSHARN